MIGVDVINGIAVTLRNLRALEDLCLGHTVADMMVILGSVDIVMGEVDR